MKVYKKLSLSDQKCLFLNCFSDFLNMYEDLNRSDLKKWVITWFKSDVQKRYYIECLNSDIELMKDDEDADLADSYRRQIIFLNNENY